MHKRLKSGSGMEPADFTVKHAASTIEEEKLGKDIISRIKKKVDEWSKKQK